MKTPNILSALGGDSRQAYITEFFANEGFDIRRYGIGGAEDNCASEEEAISDADYLLLPVPVTKDGYRLNCERDILLFDIIKKIPKDCMVLAGKLPPAIKDYFESNEIKYFDYFGDKRYVWENADITAEGAVYMLMQELDIAVRESKVLICGYGRIGKSLAKKLKALGADVTVAARKQENIVEAELCMEVDTDLLDYCREGIFDLERSYDAIFNTVPSWIFDKSNSSLLKNSIYFELASSPFGGENRFMRDNCRKYIQASGIPGKYAPKSAARAVFNALPKNRERGTKT